MATESLVNNADAGENLPAQTKPLYWLYKQGKNVWNRWAREAFTEDSINAQYETVLRIIGNDEGKVAGLKKQLEEFKALKPLSEPEKAEINQIMQIGYADWLNSMPEINGVNPNTNYPKWLNLVNELPKIEDIKLPIFRLYLYKIDFSSTNWEEKVNFCEFVFPCAVNFSAANFDSPLFNPLVPNNLYVDIDFRAAIFIVSVNFEQAKFRGTLDCSRAYFLGYSHKFSSAKFSGGADFRKAIFISNANFSSAEFSFADFGSAIFDDWANFKRAVFSDRAKFNEVEFLGLADFSEAKFQFLDLYKATFKYDAKFRQAKFAKFVPQVTSMKIEGVLDFIDASWPEPKASKDPASDALAYSQIKRRMEELKLHDQELFFFRKELLCRATASKRKAPQNRLKKLFDENWRKALLIHLYEFICECGGSVWKPMRILLLVLFCMPYVYSLLAGKLFNMDNLQHSFYLKEGLYLSAYHSLPLLLPDKKTYEKIFENMYGTPDSFNFFYSLLSGAQTIISVILFFLIGLCLRNYLRIK